MQFGWVDSCAKLPVWFNPKRLIDEMSEAKEKFNTISYLVHENELEYIFAASVHFDDSGVVNFGGVFTIPKGCVLDIRNIAITTKHKRK